MCLAVYNSKEGKELTKNEFKTAWKQNPDGGGILYAYEGKLYTVKELYSHKALFKQYQSIRKLNVNCIIHFRWSTHGLINTENTHPFMINENLGFIHNGIIDIKTGTTRSDASHFNTDYLQKLPSDFLNDQAMIWAIDKAIGYSKLVFLNSAGEHTIIGEKLGDWEGKNWFSNNSHKQVTYSNIPNYSSVGAKYPSPYKYEDKRSTTAPKSMYNNYEETCDDCGTWITDQEAEDNGYICNPCERNRKYEEDFNKALKAEELKEYKEEQRLYANWD